MRRKDDDDDNNRGILHRSPLAAARRERPRYIVLLPDDDCENRCKNDIYLSEQKKKSMNLLYICIYMLLLCFNNIIKIKKLSKREHRQVTEHNTATSGELATDDDRRRRRHCLHALAEKMRSGGDGVAGNGRR